MPRSDSLLTGRGPADSSPGAQVAPPGPGPGSGVALRLVDITKRFGRTTANRRVSFELRAGEVHALMGENGAGKTTLMRVAAGLYEPDSGHVEVRDTAVRLRKPQEALAAGIGMVHQHFTLVPTLTVAENVALAPARFPRRTDLAEVAADTKRISDDLGFGLDPDQSVSRCSVSERQRAEIVKLLHRGADILIFDEPSASLAPSEWAELARLLRQLAASGRAIVLITHKIDEVMAVADRYTVLRQGEVTGSGDISTVTRDHLVELMIGRAVRLRPERPPVPSGEAVLSISGLRVAGDSSRGMSASLLDVASLEVREHEILGVAGLAGSGQRELVETLLGLCPAAEGEMLFAGEPYDDRSPLSFWLRGGAYIPEDRHHSGVADEMSVQENLLMREAPRAPLSRYGVIRRRAARERAEGLIHSFDIRGSGPSALVRELSGGNQQKVVLARELSGQPRLIVAVQPTRGLDVAATQDVYDQLIEQRSAGAGIILVSLDLDELFALSDRIAVMVGGRLAAVVDAHDVDARAIGRLMTRAEVDL